MGRVRSVAPTVDAQTRNALVYVDLPNAALAASPAQGKPEGALAPHQLKPGMFARGEFDLGRSQGLTLPQQAIALRADVAKFQIVIVEGFVPPASSPR